MELSDAQYDEMVLLSTGRWNPRVGKSRQVGQIIEGLWIVVFIVLIFGGSFLDPLLGDYKDLVGFGLLLLFLLPVIWFRWKRHQFKHQVVKHDYFLCPWCQYVLVDLQDSGLCPECGSPYERALCRSLYQSSYAPTERDQKMKILAERRAWRRAILLRDGAIESSLNETQRGSGL